MQTFEALGLCADLLESVAAAGFESPTPIQASAIPPMLAGSDVIGQARTGTGKTAAFLLPILQRIDVERREVQGLILAPTRELAIQVADAARSFGSAAVRTRVVTVYGGQSVSGQVRELRRKPHLVVGTPGRVLDLLQRGDLWLGGLDFAVLDEADEMLQMGFVEDIEAILAFAPADRPRQTALFSATLSDDIRRIAAKHTKDPVNVSVAGGPVTVAAVTQQLVIVHPDQKLEALDRLLEVEPFDSVLIFARTRQGTADLAEALERLGHPVAALHGELTQAARETVLRRFREGLVKVVVATDVAARGLDVDTVSHVINFDPPTDADGYVHRIGRTGRAGRSGLAITLAVRRDRRAVEQIERRIKQRLEDRPMPSADEVRAARRERLRARVVEAMAEIEPYAQVVDELTEAGLDLRDVAAAAFKLVAGDRGLVVPDDPPEPQRPRRADDEALRFRIPAGRNQKVRVSDVVGSLCGDLGLAREQIGRVNLGAHRTEVWLQGAAADAAIQAGKLLLRGRVTPLMLDDNGPPPPRDERPRRPPPPARPPRPDDGKKKAHPGRMGGPRGSHPHK